MRTIQKTKQHTISDLPFYGFIAVVFVVAKLVYKQFGNDELWLFLSPVSHLVGFFSGSAVEYSSESGYFLSALNIVINEACSGFNFWLISFVIIGFAVVTQVHSQMKKLIYLLAALFIAYLLTIIANTSRIISIIKMNEIFPTWKDKYEWLHVTQGSFIYLFFLIGTYLLITKYLESEN